MHRFAFKLFLVVLAATSAVFTFAAQPLRVIVAKDPALPDAKFPDEFAAMLKQHGADSSTEASLEKAPLDKADVVVLYSAEPTPMSEGSRKALEAFIKRGGGVVVLHGAIGIGEPEWLAPLIGGAWTAHSQKYTGIVGFCYQDIDHPISHGASNFDIEDDLLWDLDLTKDAHILAATFTPKAIGKNAAKSNAKKVSVFDIQPQMWTYESTLDGGQPHRAFVCVEGGDTANFNKPNFRATLLRGIAWAAKHENADELCSPEELASLRYPEGGPSTPDASFAKAEIHPDFNGKIVASDPLISKPIAIDWDSQGRLWVAETPEYPNGRREQNTDLWRDSGSLVRSKGAREARDRICILTDTKGDGVFDKKQVFCDGLELVTSFCFYKDGIIVAQAPDVLWIRDTDGDGKADKIEKITTNWNNGDTHFTLNHLKWGLDGWIYGTCGSGGNVMTGDRKKSLGNIVSACFRMKADGSAVEQVSSKGGNSWGTYVTSENEIFFNQATSTQVLNHVVLPEWVLARGQVGKVPSFKPVISGTKLAPLTPHDRAPYAQIDAIGTFSASSGCALYEGGAWPAEWKMSFFTCEAILNVVHNEAITPNGVTFSAAKTRAPEFMASRDYWVRPIGTEIGPDGALYVLDFYNQAIVHNDTRGPAHARSGAAVRPDRDHYFGRIWRFQHKQATPLEIPNLSKAGPAELAKAIENPNKTTRDTALRLICETGGDAMIAAMLPETAKEKPVYTRICALWALQRMNGLKPEILKAAITDADPAIRKNGAYIAEAGGGTAVQTELVAGLNDTDLRVRLAMMRGLSNSELTTASAGGILALFPKLDDNWSKSAAVAAATGSPASVIEAAFSLEKPETVIDFVSAIASRMAEQKNADAFGRLMTVMADKPASTDALKRIILIGAAGLKTAPTTPVPAATLHALLSSPNPEISAAALPVAVAWDKSGNLKADVDGMLVGLLKQLDDSSVPDARRMQVATALLGARSISPEVVPAVGKFLTTKSSDALKNHVIGALSATNDESVGPLLVDVFNDLAASPQQNAFEAVITRPEWTTKFLDAVEASKIKAPSLGPANLFRLRTHSVKEISTRATAMLDKLRRPTADKDTLIRQFIPLVTKPGNAVLGKELFTKNCSICHKFGDLGNEVGPVLTTLGVHGPEQLIIDILDPNRHVDAGYEVWNVKTKDGRVQSGLIGQENGSRIVLRSPPGADVTISKDDIQTRVNTGRSLMPEGFETLGGDTIRDILAFVCADASKFRVLDLTTAFTADSRKGLYMSLDSASDTLIFKKYGIVTVEGIPFNIVNPANSQLGGNVIQLKGGGKDNFCYTLPQKVEINVGLTATKLHFLGGIAGWGATKGGDPKPIMKAIMQFADGQSETVVLNDGVEFADFIREIEVPGSKLAPNLMNDHQVRWFTVPVKHAGVMQKLTLESYGGGPAPTTVAITAEVAENK